MAVKEHDDSLEFGELNKALATMSMGEGVRGQMLCLMAGLLHLGNVSFGALDDEDAAPPARRGAPAGLGAI
eukprot:1178821-Prymnesium_polylepis.1